MIQSSAQAESIVWFKILNGTFKYNSKELSGSSTTFGSPSISYLEPISEKHQFGVSLDVFFSTTSQSVSLYGFGLIYKYFFKGQASSIITTSKELQVSTLSKWDSYIFTAFKRYTYYLGSNKIEEDRFDQNGDFFNFDTGIGTSYNIGNSMRVTGDIGATIFSFASSDDRVKFKSVLLAFGLQKEF